MTGRAYAFFDCDKSVALLEEEIGELRIAVRTPPLVEFRIEKIGSLHERNLEEIARSAEQNGMRYMMETTFTDHTNWLAAYETGTLLKAAKRNPLFADMDARIFYEQDGKYVRHE